MKKIDRTTLAQSQLAGGCCKRRSTPTKNTRSAPQPTATPPTTTPPTTTPPTGGGGVTIRP
ncbi:hypothetical protein [Burkholderia seminalis]|uniref:hypothetical protein n=1 Tax=Burkholderia seminalis TaxID=488731 RepID=UPI000666C21A|nr:hypothetical protein [Burkholderia seminalis]MCA8041102.1 hypothetical protein [Burkholderia seminalis]MCA8425508.1 hypothetical protein [Burkholderia seminalis]MCA8432857.1 hypothetical protein [Burkholderia seminalis]MDN7851944.1 hypothetical protein [Burkholderia seminalis]QTO21150.1 hypothetical protein DT99_027885 [Burkholderia seminalis]